MGESQREERRVMGGGGAKRAGGDRSRGEGEYKTFHVLYNIGFGMKGEVRNQCEESRLLLHLNINVTLLIAKVYS